MSSLTIVSRRPLDGQAEGMRQRIFNIDNVFSQLPRRYLEIKFFTSRKITVSDDGMVEINTLSFFRLYSIYKILSESNVIYVHSLYYMAMIFVPLVFLASSKKIVLDAHGIVVEETKFKNQIILSLFFSLIEKYFFKMNPKVICVSQQMVCFFKSKYPQSKARYFNYPIQTNTVCRDVSSDEIHLLRKKLNIEPSDTVFIYSGNLQKWQNVEMMMDLFHTLHRKKSVKIIILTGCLAEFQSLCKDKFDDIKQIFIGSVSPPELGPYYALSNYGVILRDAHPLNEVANPTKLTEYLYYGIIPIVLSPKIGDFYSLGYDYILATDIHLHSIFAKAKSKKNIRIAKSLLAESNSESLISFVFK